jgi:hypothetical protein
VVPPYILGRREYDFVCYTQKALIKLPFPLQLVAEEVSKELKSHGPENSSGPCSLNG